MTSKYEDLMRKPDYELAYVAVIATRPYKKDNGVWQLGIAEWGKPGYAPLDEYFSTKEEAEAEAKFRNDRVGLTETEAFAIQISSMREQNLRKRVGK